MHVFVLQFVDRGGLTHAFDLVVDDDRVDSCTIDSESLQLHFLASAKAGDDLLARIYEGRALAWCSRHVLEPTGPGEGAGGA